MTASELRPALRSHQKHHASFFCHEGFLEKCCAFFSTAGRASLYRISRCSSDGQPPWHWREVQVPCLVHRQPEHRKRFCNFVRQENQGLSGETLG
eukprot:s979_g5.t1